jgi:hypothetical protein
LDINKIDSEEKLDEFIASNKLNYEKTSGYGQKLDKLYKVRF